MDEKGGGREAVSCWVIQAAEEEMVAVKKYWIACICSRCSWIGVLVGHFGMEF